MYKEEETSSSNFSPDKIPKNRHMSQRVLTLPPCLRGEIQLPASKSISARALVLGALSGTREIRNLSDCEDTCVMRQALQQPPRTKVDVRAAGTAMRFLTALFATRPGEQRLLTGTEPWLGNQRGEIRHRTDAQKLLCLV